MLQNKVQSKVPELRFGEFRGEWKKKKLNEFASKNTTKNIEDIVLPVLTNSAVRGVVIQGSFFNKDIANSENTNGYYVVERDDFIYNPRISNYAPVGPIKRNRMDTGLMSPLYTIFRFNSECIDFMEEYFKSNHWFRYITKVSNIGARHDRMNITDADFFDLPLFIPLEDEQKKLADFLTSVDKKIELLQKKVELFKKYKKGMIHELLKQKKRFKLSNEKNYDAWKEKRIGEIFKQREERFQDNLELLSVTINSGIKRRTEIEGPDNSSRDKSNYKRVYRKDIVYNSMRMWQGASGVSPYDGVVSPAYTVLSSNSQNSSNFFGYYFKLPRIINLFERYSQGLTSDTWNLKYPQLSKIRLLVPELLEQQKIADFLTAFDAFLALKEQRLSASKKFKKYLLQNMFV